MKRYLFLLILICSFTILKAQSVDTARKSNGQDLKTDNRIFISVSGPAQFPGGEDSLKRYLAKNIIYPEDLLKKHKGGSVYISFIIEKDGSLSGIKAIRSPDEKFSIEAIRVISPVKYINGTQNGYPIREEYTIGIKFAPTM